MSPIMKTLVETLDGFPRVSGDEPWNVQRLMSRVRFSPRERG